MTNFLLSSAENPNNEPFFDILMTLTLEVNTITRQMNLFSHLLFELYSLVYLNVVFQDVQTSVQSLLPFALCLGQ